MAVEPTTLSRTSVVRDFTPGFQFRAEEGGGRTLVLRFAVYNQWAEIRSAWEGHFLERFAPGAFRKTLKDRGDKFRILLNHGADPQMGDKPIAEITDIRDEDEGPVAHARLLNGLPDYLVDGLRSGLYGGSHRFATVREDVVKHPDKTTWNPDGIEERTIREARLFEFGPVTFPAYEGATSGVRSGTDRFILERLKETGVEIHDRGGDAFIGNTQEPDSEHDRDREQDAPSTPDADPTVTSEPERRAPTTENLYGLGRQGERRPDWAL